MATSSNSDKKRTFSEMQNGDQKEEVENVNDNGSSKMEIDETKQCDASEKQINGIELIQFRHSDDQFPDSDISKIAHLVFNEEPDKLRTEITTYLCKIGICIPCIYRICNGFKCISKQPKCNELLPSLLKLEQSTHSNKGCYICNDLYFKIYECLLNDTFFLNNSNLNEYEFESYFLTIKLPPILTIRDFYVVINLHHHIQSSSEIITFPSNENGDSHKDFIYFMIISLSKDLLITQNMEKIINHFGYNHGAEIDAFGINIVMNFYHLFIEKQLQNTSHSNVFEKEKQIKSKQAKKRDKFKRMGIINNRKERGHRGGRNRRKRYQRNEEDEMQTTKCMEYKFIKTNVSKLWLSKHHFLNSLKYFLCDLDSFVMIVDMCNEIPKKIFLTNPLLPWQRVSDNVNGTHCDVKITMERPPIYIAANYNKWSRKVSQTPFAFAKSSVLTLIVEAMRKWKNLDNGNKEQKVKKMEVEQNENDNDNEKSKIINPHSNENGWINMKQNIATNNIFCCDHVIFHSAGREDMDVRMLGEGRPLLLQLINPRKSVSLHKNVEKELSDFERFCGDESKQMIGIKNMRIVDEKYQEWMKSIENTKSKKYRCLCWISKENESQSELDKMWTMNEIKYPFVIKQWTPIRVLHRRSLAEREKKLFKIELKWVCKQWISVEIAAEAGTYIKEFCHGDRGRTKPNLASMLKCKHANIIQLDVTAVST